MKSETNLPAIIKHGTPFAVAIPKVELDPELTAAITSEDYGGLEDDGQAFPIVTIRQKDVKTEDGRKLLHRAGDFRMYDPVAVTNNVEIPDVPGEPGLTITVALDQASRVYFSAMDAPVACRSNDGLTGQGKPGGKCSTCELNKLSPYYQGAQTTCKAQKNLLVFDHISKRPYVLRLGPSGLTIWKNFKTVFGQQKLPPIAIVIQVTTKYVDDGKGQYYTPVFSIVATLPVETFMQMRQIKTDATVNMAKTVDIVIDDETNHVLTGDTGGDLPPGVEPVSNKIAGVEQRAKDDEGLPF
jgi:hypothetical protein